MVEGDEAAVFTVAFCDGEKEINIGNVVINPSINYKTFQSIVSKKIGISPNQITIYLVDGNRSKFSSDYHRKTLITGKANFAVIARGKECYFLAVLKRSRRDRRRKPKQSIWPETPFILHRSYLELADLASPYLNQISQPEFPIYEDGWQTFPNFRENYSNSGFDYDNYPISDPYLCKECTEAAINKKSPDIFHLCVYDPITFGFRSPAGPIMPPRKVYA